jgi:hypothetical protein
MSEVKLIQTLNKLKEINFFYYVGLKQAKEKGLVDEVLIDTNELYE